jgi:hypothetical protein
MTSRPVETRHAVSFFKLRLRRSGRVEQPSKDGSHGLGESYLLIRCCLHLAVTKRRSNSHIAIVLSGEFPQFTAGFPGVGRKSVHFGQNVQIACTQAEKFAARFAAAGNWFNFSRLTGFSFGQPCSMLRFYH